MVQKLKRLFLKKIVKLETIKKSAFTNSELKSIVIPKSVISLEDKIFNFSEKLESIVFEDGSALKTMGKEVFSNLMKLSSITLPANLEDVGFRPFRDSKSIETINIANTNTRYQVIGGGLYDKQTQTLLYYPAGRKDKEYTVLDGTKHIGEYAFANSEHLEQIHLPESITTIGEFAFKEVTKLTNITTPKSTQTIGKLVFFGNLELTDITLLSGTFANYALNGLPKLEILTLGENVSELPDRFLTGQLDSLKKVYINYVGDNFKLEKGAVDVPQSVKFIVRNDAMKTILSEKLGDKHNIIVEETNVPDTSPVPSDTSQPDVSVGSNDTNKPDVSTGTTDTNSINRPIKPVLPNDNNKPDVPVLSNQDNEVNKNIVSSKDNQSHKQNDLIKNQNNKPESKSARNTQNSDVPVKEKANHKQKNVEKSLPRTGTSTLLSALGSVLLVIGYTIFKKRI